VPLKPRILIVAAEDRIAGPLAAGLDRLNWRTITARTRRSAIAALADLQIEAVVLDLAEDPSAALALVGALRAAYAPRLLPILALAAGNDDPEGLFDLVMAPPVHPHQIALRLEAMVRLAIAEEEFELRARTFRDYGQILDPPRTDTAPLQILAVGDPGPRFLALSYALAAVGAEALSIAGGMRRNTRLFHVPAILCQRAGTEVGVAEAYNRGLSDIVGPETSDLSAARRIAALARAYRRETAIRRALDRAKVSGVMDPLTGLFTRELFALHLGYLSRALQVRHRPLSIAVLRLEAGADASRLRSEGHLTRALPQLGSMIGRLVRAEDTAARLGADVFALALPGAGLGAARSAAERIAAVIACTAFDGGDGRSPFTVDFQVGAAELVSGESAMQTLERAAAAVALAPQDVD
jgi:two-component system cell cycle response regulator PopA